MKKLAATAIGALIIFLLSACSANVNLANPASTNFPLEIVEIPEEAAQYGTHCVSVLGSGWSCIVDLSVVNMSDEPWTGNLTANLLSEDGSRSAATDYPGDENLTGSFSQIANPGEKWEWAAHFSVGENKIFDSVEIVQDGSVVAKVPVCIGSSDGKSLGC